MSQISENGDYTVFVDAFGGTGNDVRVRVYIGGALIDEVECGDMTSGGGTDSCRVGTINWNGSAGSFSSDGTLANNF